MEYDTPTGQRIATRQHTTPKKANHKHDWQRYEICGEAKKVIDKSTQPPFVVGIAFVSLYYKCTVCGQLKHKYESLSFDEYNELVTMTNRRRAG